MHVPAARITIGAGLVGYGVWAALSAFAVVSISAWQALMTYWPLLFVLWGVLEAADDVAKAGLRHVRGWPLWVAAGGAVLAGSHLGLWRVTAHLVWSLIWAAIIVGVGLSLLLRGAVPVVRIHGRGARIDLGGWVPGDWRHGRRGDADDFAPGARQVLGSLHVGQDDPWELADRVYRQGVGDLSLDLTHARLREGETRLELRGGMGEIQVLVPPDLALHLEGRVRMGEIHLLGRTSSGFDRYLEMESDGYAQAARRLRIEMTMGMGDITVEYVL